MFLKAKPVSPRRRFTNIMTFLAVGLDLIMGSALLALPEKANAAACGTAVSPVTISATGVAFGTYDATAPAATTANGTIRIACELGVDVLPNFIVHLSSGNAEGFWPRHMRSGNARLTYNLFTDAAHATVWGDGTNGTSTHTNTEVLPMGTVEFTIHGALPPGQFVPGGIYTDTIVVRVEY